MPCASPESLAEAGRHADRLSVNIELPTPESLGRLAPDKDEPTILDAMRCLRAKIDEARAEPRQASFVPAGQSTQMIIGADASTDRTILAASSRLYAEHRLGRVYYSAFSPIPHASPALPARAAPVLREHRLYQADWLMRFYGFAQSEILDAGAGEMLDLQIDPKLAWALRHRDRFTVDVNKADRSQLLRVPGLGKRTVDRLLTTRRQRSVGLDDLRRLRVAIKTARPFVVTADRRGARARRTRPAYQAYAESAAARPVRRECLLFWCGTTRISPDGGSGRGRWSRPAFRRRRSPGERTRSRATFSPDSRLKWSPMPMLALSRETQTSCAFRAASSSAPTFTLLRSLRAGSPACAGRF